MEEIQSHKVRHHGQSFKSPAFDMTCPSKIGAQELLDSPEGSALAYLPSDKGPELVAAPVKDCLKGYGVLTHRSRQPLA